MTAPKKPVSESRRLQYSIGHGSYRRFRARIAYPNCSVHNDDCHDQCEEIIDGFCIIHYHRNRYFGSPHIPQPLTDDWKNTVRIVSLQAHKELDDAEPTEAVHPLRLSKPDHEWQSLHRTPLARQTTAETGVQPSQLAEDLRTDPQGLDR
jgi:hypothetical protein